MTSRLLLAVALVATTATLAPPARADDAAAELRARRHFEKGEKLYTLKKYQAALGEYQAAFDASPIPDFLFNIGQCYRNLGKNADAVFTYKRYLKLAPDAPNRDKVERLIAELEATLDPDARPTHDDDRPREHDDDRFHLRAPPPAPPPAPAEAPIYKKWWFWTGVGVVAAGAGVGIYAATRASGPGTDFSIVWPR